VRQAFNTWIRTSYQFDAMVAFDAVLGNPADPEKIREDMHRGDHLHPNAAGYKAMSDAVDLSLFSKFPKSNFRSK
jgi:lysophospholipase L1-like esterase